MGILLAFYVEQTDRAAFSMLSGAGKAAVVHPTGTGKKSVGFTPCKNAPTKSILRLPQSQSPT